jgi:molybdopterin-guanine dinucleotide biosynthesis protein A
VIAGFILAGGKSTRMGRDKALLPWGNSALIQHIAAKLNTVTASCTVIGEPERYADTGLECIPDIRPGYGPLAGIESALAAKRADLNLIVGCDMPDLQTDWLEALIKKAQHSPRLAAVLRDGLGRLHPLCGIYKAAALDAVTAALDAGRLKLTHFVQDLPSDEVQVTAAIRNLNTPADWGDWQSHQTSKAC